MVFTGRYAIDQSKVRPASSLAAMASPSLQLIYLDHHYWRAECARVALFMAGVPFEDARMDYNGTWVMASRRFVSNAPSWLARQDSIGRSELPQLTYDHDGECCSKLHSNIVCIKCVHSIWDDWGIYDFWRVKEWLGGHLALDALSV